MAAEALILPAGSPYDRQQVCEHAESLARRYGEVPLDVDHELWTVHAVSDTACTVCDRATCSPAYSQAGVSYCASCARRHLRNASL